MRYDQGNPEELREKFWKELADSPFVMLQLDGEPAGAVPMTAQLDKDANHAIWFFTTRDGHFGPGGDATATFAGKSHEVFARFAGTLHTETSRERLDALWNNFVEAWYPGGKDDPSLLMLRMDLGSAEIWSGKVGVWDTVKMALGLDVRSTIKGGHVETQL
jgi:general stress protein 26